jgi:type IV secretory pathway VirD2 relaxase
MNAPSLRCEDDRHHFRFIVSPEDGAELGDLKTFTRELMLDVEKDLGTKLDWLAVDHWNTDNPHVHVLIRGRAGDGKDLVISREYISRGFRDRAAERVTLELGPRSEQDIRTALEREVESEHSTSLDRALRDISDECGGVADLRPGPNAEHPELRSLLLGRAAKLERLGLADPVGPACWTLKPGLDQTLRQLGIRGDIIKTMHQAMSNAGREPDVSTFALHGEEPTDPVLGRLVKRGLDDELKGTAYAIVAGVDGRTHHLKFSDVEMTGEAPVGAIVEARAYDDTNGRRRLALATRSDLSVEAQVTASGATWLDRQLLAKDPPLSGGGFGAEVRNAMDRRADHLIEEGLARRQGQRIVFARDLLDTLRRLRAGRRGRQTRDRNRPYTSPLHRRRTRRWHLSPTRDAGVGPLRHDRRWAWISVGPVAARARTETRPACRGHNDAWWRCRLEFRAQAGGGHLMTRNGTALAPNSTIIRFARRSVPAHAPHKFSLALHPQSSADLSSS